VAHFDQRLGQKRYYTFRASIQTRWNTFDERGYLCDSHNCSAGLDHPRRTAEALLLT
jgi:hypothetical protein